MARLTLAASRDNDSVDSRPASSGRAAVGMNDEDLSLANPYGFLASQRYPLPFDVHLVLRSYFRTRLRISTEGAINALQLELSPADVGRGRVRVDGDDHTLWLTDETGEALLQVEVMPLDPSNCLLSASCWQADAWPEYKRMIETAVRLLDGSQGQTLVWEEIVQEGNRIHEQHLTYCMAVRHYGGEWVLWDDYEELLRGAGEEDGGRVPYYEYVIRRYLTEEGWVPSCELPDAWQRDALASTHEEENVRGSGTTRPEERDDSLKGTQKLVEQTMHVDQLLSNVPAMRQHIQSYNPQTAREIIKALPKAWSLYGSEGGRWGPGLITRFCNHRRETVGRYLRAFKEAGIRRIQSIDIPHRYSKPRK